ncbi:unnamed protein product [Meganyctiphanes norvegica]|uniref:Ig-like domain-containing protein n=1 Tax=Meganyctiphanes norvegica TaxID=48144 RepID=A0AAV2RM39_MEGNR
MTKTRGIKMHACLLIIGSAMVAAQAMDGPSPDADTEFTVQPSNVTVPEGQHAIMKCKTTSKADVCRWYYLENGLSFYDTRFTPTLVKDFSPSHHHDCSIRFTKVRKVQEGQWLCQALKIHSTRFIMSKPATLRVITESETSTMDPSLYTPTDEPREGRNGGIDTEVEEEDVVKFEINEENEEEHIQNAPVGETSILKCKVNRPITDCSWIMPQGAVFHLTKADTNRGQSPYALVGDLKEGNCSLVISEVRLQDEGNWRCVVKVEGLDAVKGPLIHLHILDPANPIYHDPGLTLRVPQVDSANLLIIILVATSVVLFIVVIFLFSCLYRRLKENSVETRKILENSPRTSADLSTRIIPTTDLKSDMKIDFQPGSRSPLCYSDIDHYQYHDYSEIDSNYTKYLDMSGIGTPSDGYIRISDDVTRASNRTILSNVSTLPMRRDRSVSNSTTSTTLSAITPGGSSHNFDNPSYNSESNNINGFCQPEAIYPEHLYEEIKERPQPKEDESKPGKMDIIEEVKTPETTPEILSPETPTYSNTVEDYNGYMIPKDKNSITSDAKEKKEVKKINNPVQKPALPTPKGSQESLNSLQNGSTPITVVAPPYSCIGDTGLVPLHPAIQAINNEGYSRVGTVIPNSTDIYNIPNNIPINPMDNYDTPRNIESYDVPRNIPVDPFERYDTPTNIPVEGRENNDTSNLSPANSVTSLNIPAAMEVRVEGLLGTTV